MIDVDIRDPWFGNAARAMQNLSAITGRGMDDLTVAHAKGVLKRTIRYTPPQGQNLKGQAARKALEKRMLADIHGIFIRVEKPVLARVDSQRVKRGGAVAAVFYQHKMRKRSQAWRRTGRAEHNRYFASVTDLNRLHKDLKKHAGKLGSGWSTGAAKMGVTLPAYMRRHGSGSGSYSKRRTSKGLHIAIENHGLFARGHLYSVIQSAESQQYNATVNQTAFLLRKLERDILLIDRTT